MTESHSTTAADAAGNIPEYTVGELSAAVKRSVEGAFQRVRVRGEVTRLARPRSGHLYFRLKDEHAVLEAICWRGVANALRFPPEDGLEVIRGLVGGLDDALRPGGWVGLEIGNSQEEAVVRMLEAVPALGSVGVHDDLAGRQRYVLARKT